MKPKHPLSLARLKYARHKALAKFRNIAFNFTFEEWYDWWLSNGVDKNVKQQYRTDRDRKCMCRYGDVGAYEASNVYCTDAVENVKHSYQNGNPRIKPNAMPNYRWKDDVVNYHTLTRVIGVDPKQVHLYRKDDYDRLNQHETLKLIKRWHCYIPQKRQKIWITPHGQFTNMQAAADSVGMDQYRFQYYCNKGVYQKKVIALVPDLKDYVLQHHRYPDPWFPDDFQDEKVIK